MSDETACWFCGGPLTDENKAPFALPVEHDKYRTYPCTHCMKRASNNLESDRRDRLEKERIVEQKKKVEEAKITLNGVQIKGLLKVLHKAELALQPTNQGSRGYYSSFTRCGACENGTSDYREINHDVGCEYLSAKAFIQHLQYELEIASGQRPITEVIERSNMLDLFNEKDKHFMISDKPWYRRFGGL